MRFLKLPLLLTFVASLFCLAQTAQGQSRQRWSFGPRVGVNYSTLVGQVGNARTPVPHYLPGLSAGIGALYSDISRFGLGFDLLYSQRGYRYDNKGIIPPPGFEFALAEFTAVNRIHYVEVPITARYFLNRTGTFRPNIFVGPVFSARLGARDRISIKNGQEINANNTRDYRPGEFGVTAGFQLNFRASDRQRFTVDGRYTYGLTDALTYVNGVHNQQFTLGLGYNFGIGRQYQPGDPKLTVPN